MSYLIPDNEPTAPEAQAAAPEAGSLDSAPAPVATEVAPMPAAEPAVDPYAAAPADPYAAAPMDDPYAAAPASDPFMGAPMAEAMPVAPAPSGAGLSVQAPMLHQVEPGVPTFGGTRNGLSSLVLDVEVPVEVCLGDASLTVEEFLDLGPGAVVELDTAIDAAIELRVRGKLVAHGQLVTINGQYGLRITETTER